MNAAASSGEEKKLDGIKERERGEGKKKSSATSSLLLLLWPWVA